MSMIRSCPDRLEFKNECYSTVNQVNQQKTTIFALIVWSNIELLQIFIFEPQGLAVIFSHRQVYVKREGRTLFFHTKIRIYYFCAFISRT
jgi:hypothetical protein